MTDINEKNQSAEAKTELEELHIKSIEKLSISETEEELDALMRRHEAERERDRQEHYRDPSRREKGAAKRKKRRRNAAERRTRPVAEHAAGEAVRRLGDAIAAFRNRERTPRETEKPKSLLEQFAEQEKGLQDEPLRRREGVIRRIRRFIRTVSKRRVRMNSRAYYTHEKKRAVYKAIFYDCFSPLADAWEGLLETAWNFFSELAQDAWALLLFSVDIAVKVSYVLWSSVLILWDFVWDIRYWIEANKIVFLRRFVLFVFSTASVAIFWGSITAYEYSYYGKVLGVAKSQYEVYRTIDVLGDKLSEASGANVSLNVERDIEFRRVMGFSLNVDTDEEILNTLTYMKDIHVIAYGIYIDDKMEVVLESEETALALLRSIRDTYAGEKAGVKYSSVAFRENITVREEGVKLGEIWNEKNAARYLMSGTKVERKHIVAQNETFAQIAQKYGITQSDLAAANPNINRDKLYIGQELYLTYGTPLVTVHSTETATYNEQIEYGTQYIDNASIYLGETEVKSRGIYGQQRIVAEIVRTNGEEVSKKILSSDRLSEPVDEVLYRGTKPIPPREGTGTFNYPIRTYTISSRFGMRWGRMHTGTDFAAPTGTKIYASDGGTVTFAGWKGQLGYLVIIDHGSLYETYYGHCSKLLVSAGEKVYQGQNIALVGSTGYSTGSHLHFEVRYLDRPMNPLDFL